MTAILLTPLFQQQLDNNGDPLDGGMIYSYQAGTTTPLATYTDATGTIPASNPVILDSAGRADVWGSGVYKFVLTDSNGVQVGDTIDNVTAVYGAGDMTKSIYDPANIAQQVVGTGAVQTLSNKTLTSPTFTGTSTADVITANSITVGGNPLIVTPFVAYTPVFTGFGTVSAVAMYSRRVGDVLHVQGRFTSGTSTAVEARMELGFNGTSGGLTSAGSTKLPSISLAGPAAYSGLGALSFYCLIEQSVGYITFSIQNATLAGLTKRNGSNALAAGESLAINIMIPINGW